VTKMLKVRKWWKCWWKPRQYSIPIRRAKAAFETEDNTKATKENLQQEFPDAIVVQPKRTTNFYPKEIRRTKIEGKVPGIYNNGNVYLVADTKLLRSYQTYRHETLGPKE
jgi:hypothetical protein